MAHIVKECMVRAIFRYLHFGLKYILSIFVPAYPVQGHTRAQAYSSVHLVRGCVYLEKGCSLSQCTKYIHLC